MRNRMKPFQALTLFRLLRRLIVLAAIGSSFAAPAKLAIIESSRSAADLAALLTATLSRNPSLMLLEREQIEKILRERSLAATQITNVLASSRILGADALLFVEVAGAKTNQSINLRLVSVREGAVLDTLSSAFVQEGLDRWAETISAQIARTAAKIGADRSKLVPVTLLNFRSPTANAASELLDRELTSLLLSRLTRETNLLLL